MYQGNQMIRTHIEEKFEGQLGVMCLIQIVESIMGITSLLVDICDNISSLGWASINPESVTLRWKQSYIISRLSNIYHSIDSGMLMVHVFGHQNSQILDSNLISIAYLNVQLDALSEYIMASFLRSPAPRIPLALRSCYQDYPFAEFRSIPITPSLLFIKFLGIRYFNTGLIKN